MNGTRISASPLPAARQLVGEGHEVLFLLEQRAQEGKVFLELDVVDAGALEHRDPVDELARARALSQTPHAADLVESLEGLVDEAFVNFGVVDADDVVHQLGRRGSR